MPELPHPSLIVFDLDNTLYDYDQPNAFATQALIQEISFQSAIDTLEVKNALDVSRINVKRRLGNTASSHSRLLYISEIYRLLKLKPVAEQFLILENLFWDSYLSQMKLFPGVIDFIQSLKVRDIPLALVTDLTSNIQYRKLLKLGLSSSFDFILTSEEVGGDKSSGLPFELLSKIYLQTVAGTWFIGDNQHDYPSSANNGAIFFQKTKSTVPGRQGNKFVFQDFGELKNLLV